MALRCTCYASLQHLGRTQSRCHMGATHSRVAHVLHSLAAPMHNARVNMCIEARAPVCDHRAVPSGPQTRAFARVIQSSVPALSHTMCFSM